jgi:N-acetylglucosamine kinase-like BadF-type ATPase
LKAVVQAIDGRGEKTSLLELFDEEYKLNSLETIIKAVYTDNFDIASLAVTVFEAAETGDKIAVSILDKTVDALCLHIKTMVEKIKVKDTLGISFVGSIVTNDNYVRTHVLRTLKDKFPFLVLTASENDPLEGAIVMAKNATKN